VVSFTFYQLKQWAIYEKIRAVIQYNPEIEIFRGEFTGLNGGGNFYAENVKALKRNEDNP
jgi:predicted HicB family RNase H-like nuclease